MRNAMNNPSGLSREAAGLTLVEMLLVLLILAALAGVALQSTDQLVDQSRFEATQSTLDQIESAVIGPATQRDTDGSPLITGFVADVGRLPTAVGTDPATQLRQLWQNIEGLPVWGLVSPPGDAQVRLGAGWRGPYIRLGVGAQTLTDGWGQPMQLLLADDLTELDDGDPVFIIRSLGSDNLPGDGGDPYSVDLPVIFQRAGAQAVPPRHTGTVAGTVYLEESGDHPPANTGQLIVVRVYGPVDGSALTIGQFTAMPDGGPVNYRFDQDNDNVDDPIAIGPRVLRAYLLNTTNVPDAQQRLDNDPSLTHVSAAVRLMLRPGGQTRDLILQPTPATP